MRPGLAATGLKARRRVTRVSKPAKQLTKRQWRKVAERQPFDVLYHVSRTFFIVILILLIVCTVVDILPQSFSSGQFWNSIIVICAMSLILAWALTLSLFRRVTVNRWLAALPRWHQLGRRDIGRRLKERILAARKRCHELFINQQDFTQVMHPGLQNPQMSAHGRALDIEVPFWEITDMLPMFVEDYCTMLVPELGRSAGTSLREYLDTVARSELLTPDAGPYLDRFLSLYEELRYSGRNVSQDTLLELMGAFTSVLNRFQLPESGNVRIQEPLPPPGRSPSSRDDGGYLSLVPSEALASSQSSFSSSTDSVRIYPTRTQDSWVSHESSASQSPSQIGTRVRGRWRHRGSSLLSLLASDPGEPIPVLPRRPAIHENPENHLLPPRDAEDANGRQWFRMGRRASRPSTHSTSNLSLPE